MLSKAFRSTPAQPKTAFIRFLASALLAGSLGWLPAFTAYGQVFISEFMADNESGLRDDTGQYSDWIEICNSGTTQVNLQGWGLTDRQGDNTPWLFPATNLPPGGTLIVFASGLDRRVAGAALHTDFKLSASGDYLGLLRPDLSVVSEFSPTYPVQIANVSYGYARNTLPLTLVTTGTVGRVTVPLNGNLGTTWTATAFNDTSWAKATNGAGYEVAGGFATNYPGEVFSDAPLAYWRFSETGTSQAVNQGSLGSSAQGTYNGAATNSQVGPRPPEFAGFEAANTAAKLAAGGYVEVPYRAALNPNGPFTVEAWAKPDSTGSSRAVVSSQLRTGTGRSGYILYQSAQWEFHVGDGSGYVASVRAGLPVVGQWTHLVGVYDGTAASLYVDGVLMGTVAGSRPFVPNASNPLRIGVNNSGGGQYLGLVDEVTVFGRVSTDTEVAHRYEVSRSAVRNYTGLIKTDLSATMLNVNSCAYLRLPFVVSNLTQIQGLTLQMKYNDGFAAYLNGQLVLSANSPASPGWNSTATTERAGTTSQQAEAFDLSGHVGKLVTGTNVLSVHGLNISITNSDFLLLPHLTAQPDGNWQTNTSYFTTPTPGALNQAGADQLGPIVTEPSHAPYLPGTNDSITVTCRVTPALGAISTVTLYWRVMYGSTSTLPMYDDGLHGDGAASDGVYGATIPYIQNSVRIYAAGQMVRWYITATDAQARTTRLPLFFAGTAAEEYLGTVVAPGYVTSSIPVIHLFVQNYANGVGVDSTSKVGGPASVYYDGEFYDNVHMYVRGNSTVGYLKKSHSIEFNSAHKFRHPGPGGMRLGKTSFTADYPDPSYMRQRLTFWLCEQAGAPGPFYHPVRLQMNGDFYQLANHNDLHGEEMLERLGRDPNGALYNAAGTIVPYKQSTGGFDKKTRRWEGDTDYVAMANAISESLPVGLRQTNMFDLFDLAEVISYLTVARFVHENDDVWANMTVYRDSDGDGLWRIIPFDMNLSWGAAYVDSAVLNGLQVTNDAVKAHPLYGSSQTIWTDGGMWNRLYDVIFQVPQTREMFLRHQRTFLDTWIKQQGDPTSILEPMLLQWRDEIATDATLDRSEWGWPGQGGQCNFPPGINLTAGVNMILNEYLPGRRAHYYGKHCVTNTALPVGITKANNAGIPLPQPTNAAISIANWDYSPASGNQDHEYVRLANTNSFAVDLTGWRLTGGIRHDLKTGTVIPAGGSLYLSPNVAAFLTRPTAPRGGMGLFVQGDYSGQLSAWGDSLELVNAQGVVISSASYPAAPSLAQQYLRITEIMYNPAGAPAINPDPQQFEYIELKNISPSVTLNLTNVRFTAGITFNFSNGSIPSLTPGQRILIVRNAAAFTARHGASLPVAGQFVGALDNAGENLRLEDSVGEKILDFDYNNSWYPITDGLGFSLVIVDQNAAWSTWGEKTSWRASGQFSGSPGAEDPGAASLQPIVVNEVLSHSDAGVLDTIELRNLAGTNVNVGGWLLTDDFQIPAKYRLPDNTWVPAYGFKAFTTADFGTGSNSFALSEYGEGAYLFQANAQGVLSGFWHGFEFGASPNGVSFGRHVTSIGEEHFVLLSDFTPQQTNAYPRVGPVIFSEIMYGPPGTQEEFLELYNISTGSVPFFCTFTNEPGYGLSARTNTWRIRNGVDFDFPQGISLAAGARLLIAGFDPTTNAAKTATVRLEYNIPTNVPIYGPWSGKLNNTDETVELLAPDKPDVLPGSIIVPYVVQERVHYSDVPPWPTAPDGGGSSLQRLSDNLYANDPANWFADLPTAGRPANLATPPEITSTTATSSQVILTVSTAAGRSYTLEYKDSLSVTNWTALPPAVTATAAALSFTNETGSAGQRFFRVRMD